jgi:1-acyl-sn-glycerol-3-phosphate acyltransferase
VIRVVRLLILLRSCFAIVFAVVLTFVLSAIVIAVSLFGAHGIADSIIRFWSTAILRAFNIDVVIHDQDVVPMDRGVLFLFNHQSFFDIFSIYRGARKRTRFGAKIELFKIPLFGKAMLMTGSLPIARHNRAEVFRYYKQAESKFAENWNFVLAPEGTRQTRPEIGPFKKGPFFFAISAHAPIVPVVIRGALEVMPKNSYIPNADRWRSAIHLRYLAPIETDGYNDEDVDRLAELVRARMTKAFEKLPRPI